jgi:hypothetical protein
MARPTNQMNPLAAVLVAVTLWNLPAWSQSYHRHNITGGLGAGQPRGDLRDLFNDSFGAEIGYGYRFHQLFQADIGLETLFGAAGVRDFLPTQFGNLRIRDYQFLLPMGGRAIFPIADEKILVYGGGGGAYLRYSERVRQVSDYFRIGCDVCSARSGWGYYGLVGASVALDRGRNFRLGVTSKVYRGHTEGDPLGELAGRRTRDRWINIFGEFTFSF